jgi:hypothetical protein
MTLTRSRVLGAGLAAAVAAGTMLVAPPAAHAAPVFTQLETDPYFYSSYSGGPCTDDGSTGSAPADVPVPENGTPVTAAVSSTGKYYATGTPADKITNSSSLQATATATTAAGQPASVKVAFSGSVTADAVNATSACNVYAPAGLEVNFEFTLAQPMWATLNIAKKGAVYAEAYIHGDYSVPGYPYMDIYGEHLDGTGTSTVLLPAGTYAGYVEGDVRKQVNKDFSGTGSGTASITFAPVGSASKAPSGKASKYVALPGARACATHNATATLTTKKKRVKQIEKITFTVNGTKAATLKGKKLKKGKAVALALADNAAADITATVALKNGKKKTVNASYLACTS